MPFSLQDEARNTQTGHLWASNRKLRHSQINFVSAGSSLPNKSAIPQAEKPATLDEAHCRLIPPQASLATMSIKDHNLNGSNKNSNQFHDEDTLITAGTPSKAKLEEMDGHQSANPLFFINSVGMQVNRDADLVLQKGPRQLSPLSSDSSEEVIVFTGRRNALEIMSDKHDPRQKERGSDDSRNVLVDSGQSAAASIGNAHAPFAGLLEPCQPQGAGELNMKGAVNPNSLDSRTGRTSPSDLPSPSRRERQRRHGRSKRNARSQGKEDEILADYIANMTDRDDFNESSSNVHRNGGTAQEPLTQLRSQAATTGDAAEDAINALINDSLDWDPTDLRDFDDLSTSAEACFNIDKILSKRQRPSGKQYLVVGEDHSADDARWLPLSALSSTNAREHIRVFESTQGAFNLGVTSSIVSDDGVDDEQLAADLQEDMDDFEDERDTLERRKARMTDEQIARLLSKQEELGLGSSELFLFDGDDEDEDKLLGGPEGVLAFGAPAAIKRPKRGKSKHKHSTPHESPSATLFADVLEQDPYGGFDVMDYERPSLRKAPKGRRGAPTFELSDVELEASLQIAWEKDRSKKKIRKKEREELRAQGLLDRQNQSDVRSRYREGISFNKVKDELMEFMFSARQRYVELPSHSRSSILIASSLALPPMAQKDRKMIHEMAHVLRLKSKSNGEGRARFPVLYKTARTGDVKEASLGKVESLLDSRRFFPRKEVKGSRKTAVPKLGRASAGNVAGVSYRDGEVVGAAAPEIGAENRGRAILEKMGWSKGTALGALNNKGILQPVTHIVKTTKAGLG
ncbi:MAG: hypothetical protein Q9181_000379 [Wetmoreana brouardii]